VADQIPAHPAFVESYGPTSREQTARAAQAFAWSLNAEPAQSPAENVRSIFRTLTRQSPDRCFMVGYRVHHEADLTNKIHTVDVLHIC